MKNLVICLILLSAIIIPLACGNQNNAPVGPIVAVSTPTATSTPTITPGGATFTFTQTFTNTFSPTITATPSNTFAGGFTWTPTNTATNTGTSTSTYTMTPTNTVTPTFTSNLTITPAVYEHTYGTSGPANGMVIEGSSSPATEYMTLAESSTTAPGYSAVETFILTTGGVTFGAFPGVGGAVYQGIPTPATTPPWSPVTVYLKAPQGYVNPGGFGPVGGYSGGGTSYTPANSGMAAVLDNSAGPATLYEGNDDEGDPTFNGWYSYYGAAYQPVEVTGYGYSTFNNPKSLTCDALGNLYVADTGNHAVEEFTGFGGPIYGPAGLHETFGNAGLVMSNGFTSVAFKSPYAVTCDSNNNVWVTDTGYSPSMVQEYSFAGGVSQITAWQTMSGCIATGITVIPTTATLFPGYVYIADSGNNQVEIYSPIGTLEGLLTDPHSVYEGGAAFRPSCIGFDNFGYLWVADTANSNIISFKPQ